MTEEQKKWHWMMEWCRVRRHAPADFWDLAEEAYAAVSRVPPHLQNPSSLVSSDHENKPKNPLREIQEPNVEPSNKN